MSAAPQAPPHRVPEVFALASDRYFELTAVARVTGAPFADVFTAFWDGDLDPDALRGDPGDRHWVSETAMDRWFFGRWPAKRKA